VPDWLYSNGHIRMTVSSRPAVLSVDVEDYFHVEAFADVVARDQWPSFPSRVETDTRRLLDLFDTAGVKATCFILGWVAERYPGLVREIAGRGHEPACHSYWHRPIMQLTPEQFRSDTRRAKDAIEQAAGDGICGYRAPTFSITRRSLWALEVLAEEGFTYDSSIFPVRHDLYGIPDAPRAPFRTHGLVECPMTTFRVGSANLPVGGGGYLRLLPYWYTTTGIRRAWSQGVPLITYVHPWEVDPEQPRIKGRLTSRLRHYTNLSRTAPRLARLCSWAPFRCFRDSGLLASADLPKEELTTPI
jgi:polysaccharide deacetylase family protein (PEP-CTERM system associated)